MEKKINISNDTVQIFTSYLEDVQLIKIVKKYSTKLIDQDKAPKKIYCIDTGLSNITGFKMAKNTGKAMENIVAIELFRRKELFSLQTEIFYWKDYQNHEIDFVIKEGFQISQLIQVTYANSQEEIEAREWRSLIKAKNELNCTNTLLITWNFDGELKINGDTFTCQSLWKWLLIPYFELKKI